MASSSFYSSRDMKTVMRFRPPANQIAHRGAFWCNRWLRKPETSVWANCRDGHSYVWIFHRVKLTLRGRIKRDIVLINVAFSPQAFCTDNGRESDQPVFLCWYYQGWVFNRHMHQDDPSMNWWLSVHSEPPFAIPAEWWDKIRIRPLMHR